MALQLAFKQVRFINDTTSHDTHGAQMQAGAELERGGGLQPVQLHLRQGAPEGSTRQITVHSSTCQKVPEGSSCVSRTHQKAVAQAAQGVCSLSVLGRFTRLATAAGAVAAVARLDEIS